MSAICQSRSRSHRHRHTNHGPFITRVVFVGRRRRRIIVVRRRQPYSLHGYVVIVSRVHVSLVFEAGFLFFLLTVRVQNVPNSCEYFTTSVFGAREPTTSLLCFYSLALDRPYLLVETLHVIITIIIAVSDK